MMNNLDLEFPNHKKCLISVIQSFKTRILKFDVQIVKIQMGATNPKIIPGQDSDIDNTITRQY